MTRKEVITWLRRLQEAIERNKVIIPKTWKGSIFRALLVAIHSLEVDEEYNLLYEETAKKIAPAAEEKEAKTAPCMITIDDAMNAFSDLMRGDVDENDAETFYIMLKDKAEIRAENN